MDISIVIPVFNEEESLKELESWINRVMLENNFSYEVFFLDDGSTDSSWKIIQELNKKSSCNKGVKFRRNYGKSAALHTGFKMASGDVVITMDADLQDSPEEIPGLYSMIINDKHDLVSGWKQKRYDPFTKTIPSRFWNWLARKVTGIKLNDFNCGLKAYRNEVVKTIEVYGEMHRYIPILVKKAGFLRIGEKVVQHQPRKYGHSKYGFERFMNGILDLLSISFISRFGKRPMHFFGTLGTMMFLIGFFLAAYLGIHKLILVANHVKAGRVTESSFFYLSLTAMIIGSQLFLAGFIGELITRNATERNVYQIESEI